MPGQRSQTTTQVSVEAIIDFLPDAALVVGKDGVVSQCNRNAEETFGFPPGALAGRRVEDLIPPRFRSGHEKVRSGYEDGPVARPMGAGLDLWGMRFDGTEFPVDISLAPVETPAGCFTVALVRDISERIDDRERITLLSERDRIARDLHDRVIQRIFATGLGLQAAAARTGDQQALQRINHAIDELDATIRELRTSIFELESRPSSSPTRSSEVRERLLEVAARAAEGLGFHPAVRFSGAIDLHIGESLAADLMAVIREGLSNIAKYAKARTAEVSIAVDGREVVVIVVDDGRGIGTPRRSSGLDNLRSRAEARGGSLSVGNRDGGGTRLEWRAPLDGD